MANPVTRIIIAAKDEASAVFGSLQTKVAGVAAAIGGYFAGKFIFGDAIGSARDFERAMSSVQAASGATGEDLKTLRTAAEQAGTTTRYSSVEAAGALETLSKSGLSASQSVQALPAVLALAQAGGIELGAAADFVTKAVNGMGLSFGEAGRVADVLAQGANASSTSVDGLAGALSYAAPLAKSLGLSLEQTVAIIGKFADAGIDASRAGTALNSILAQFSDPASRFRRELADAGITTSDFDQALRQLAAAGPSGQRAINAVGQEAGPALRALLNQGMGALDELRGKLESSAGSAKAFGEVVSNNLDGAVKGLGSAWDATIIKLGTPVLDTLKGQVNAIAARLQEFVANGTATRFGESIRAAFESAGTWVAEFFGKIDFTTLATGLQAFAARAGEYFAIIGQRATQASAALQTAWGVMSAGVNAVMGALFKVAEAFSGVVSNILSGVALLNEGLARVTFGGVSERFRTMAEEIRTHAGAMWAVSEEFAQRSSAAFDGVVNGAETARAGWAKLTTGAQESATAATAAMQQVAEQAGITADQLDALGANAEVSAGKVVQAGEVSAQAANGMSKLADGAKSAADKVRDAAASAEQIESAFKRLGVTSSAELQRTARNAQRDFEMIRDSGTASTRDIQSAFAAYAEKAIAANNGVADAAIRAQAAQLGLSVEADSSGRIVVRSMQEAAAATQRVGEAAESSASGYDSMADSAERAAEAAKKAEEAKAGGSSRAKNLTGNFDSAALGILNRAESLGGLGLRKEILEEYQRQFKDQMRVSSFGLADYNKFFQGVSDRLDQMQIQQEQASGRFEANKPRITGTAEREQVTTYRVQIGTGAGRTTTINTASQADANALTELLRQLESDMSRA